MTHRCLLIGGPLDGQVAELDDITCTMPFVYRRQCGRYVQMTEKERRRHVRESALDRIASFLLRWEPLPLPKRQKRQGPRSAAPAPR